MKSQFISIIPLLIICLCVAFYAAPRVSFADFNSVNAMIFLSPEGGDSGASAPIEAQPGVSIGSGTSEGEPENKEGVAQSEKPQKDIQQHAAEQAERNQRDIEAGRGTPDRPATPVNLAQYHTERAKTDQEDQATADLKKQQADHANIGAGGGDEENDDGKEE